MSAAPVLSKPAAGGGATQAKSVGTRWWTGYALLAPGFLWLSIFFIVPTIVLVSTSLQRGNIYDGFTFQWAFSNYWEALFGSDVRDGYLDVYIRSIAFALTATLLCLAVAYPLAYTIAFKAGRWKNLMLVLVIAPFFTSFLLRTNAWKTILSDAGFLVGFLDDIGVLAVLEAIGVIDGPRLLSTPIAVILGLAYNFLPFMTLPLYASLERIDVRLIEAAQDLYASGWTAFRKVTFPLSMPGVVAGTLLTFIPATGDPVNAGLLGSPAESMIGNTIDNQFKLLTNYPLASALSVMLMAMIVTMVAIYVRRAGTEELV